MFCLGIYNIDVKHISVPRYDTVAIKVVISTWFSDPRVKQFLPDEEDWHRLPRGCVHNVLHTVLGLEYSDWIRKHLEERNEKLKKEANAEIMMDPRMYEAFMKSTLCARKSTVVCRLFNFLSNLFFSRTESKGTAPWMMKNGATRRRNKQQIKAADQAKRLQAAQEAATIAKANKLEREVA